MNKEPSVLTRMRLSCCWGDNLNEKELNEVVDYINYLQQENQQLKEDINFCLHSIKQEMEMSTDSRTKKEMKTCYEILKRWNNE